MWPKLCSGDVGGTSPDPQERPGAQVPGLVWASRRGPCQAGARSTAVSVSCDFAAACFPDAGLVGLAAIEPVSRGAVRSLMKSYTILAPACARWPNAIAACEPAAQAPGWRMQNCRMSATVAEAADTASIAPVPALGTAASCCLPPLGSSTRTRPIQN